MLKEFEPALESLKTATELAPNNLMAWASYASACKFTGKADEQKMAEAKVVELVEKSKAEEPEEPADEPEAEEPEAGTSLLDINIPE